MRKRHGATRILTEHFFRRFFDNDTIQTDGDTLTTVVRALSVVAVPGMMIAFFMQNQYPKRSLWGSIEDQYFFVLFSFVVMGAVSIFEWEMLFPDRLDFLVLSPLSLKPMQMLAGKAAALIGFLGLFLVGCNLCGTLMLPAITRHVVVVNDHVMVTGEFFRQVYAHGIAVLLAGMFSALLFLALGGVLLCVLKASQFRIVSPILQMLSVAALALLMLGYVQYGGSMQAMLSGSLGRARWIPPLWFLGLYELLFHGSAAPAFAREMARYAVRGTMAAAVVVLLTYPIAWARMRRMAVEGTSCKRRRPSRWLVRLVHMVVRRPEERAVFHFIGQTIARNNRYQVYLAVYWGTGVALAVACGTTWRVSGVGIQLGSSDNGLHAIMPLLLFWVIAGLRSAFAFPINLAAGWIFRSTGVRIGDCTTAARRWVFLCGVAVTCSIVVILRMVGWDLRHLVVQAVFGLCLCVLLTDGFFFQKSVPFTRPRMPGKTSLPLMLTLYVGVLPLFLLGVIRMELRMEESLMKLLLLGLAVAMIHVATRLMRRGPDEVEEEMEGYEGEFQLLGLATH
jgi:hypothetical protein